MPAKKNQIVEEYARMWPREVFDCLIPNENSGRKKILGKGLDLVNEPGVYVLYRNDIPYYIGQATKLRHRLWLHAGSPGARYGNFWNYFSAFVIHDPKMRNEVEGILIAAMPTAKCETQTQTGQVSVSRESDGTENQKVSGKSTLVIQ